MVWRQDCRCGRSRRAWDVHLYAMSRGERQRQRSGYRARRPNVRPGTGPAAQDGQARPLPPAAPGRRGRAGERLVAASRSRRGWLSRIPTTRRCR